jgi:hypothetical protein
MVAQLNEILEKYMLAKYRKNRQRHRIGWNGYHRAEKISNAVRRMLGKIAAAKQGPFQ